MRHCFDGFRFIIFDGNDAFGIWKEAENEPHSFDDPIALCTHQLVVAGDIGLTFRTVSDHVVNLFRIARGEFYVRWKTCAAKADDPGPFDGIENLRSGKGRCVPVNTDSRCRCKLSVICDDDAGGPSSGYGVTFLDCFYGAGTGTDDVCGDKAVCFRDQLSGKYGIAFFYDRFCRLADVLVYRKYEIS